METLKIFTATLCRAQKEELKNRDGESDRGRRRNF